MGERELAFGLLDYALRSLGTRRTATQAVRPDLRVTGDGGAFERRPEEPARGAPELRPHREPEEKPSRSHDAGGNRPRERAGTEPEPRAAAPAGFVAGDR